MVLEMQEGAAHNHHTQCKLLDECERKKNAKVKWEITMMAVMVVGGDPKLLLCNIRAISWKLSSQSNGFLLHHTENENVTTTTVFK